MAMRKTQFANAQWNQRLSTCGALIPLVVFCCRWKLLQDFLGSYHLPTLVLLGFRGSWWELDRRDNNSLPPAPTCAAELKRQREPWPRRAIAEAVTITVNIEFSENLEANTKQPFKYMPYDTEWSYMLAAFENKLTEPEWRHVDVVIPGHFARRLQHVPRQWHGRDRHLQLKHTRM